MDRVQLLDEFIEDNEIATRDELMLCDAVAGWNEDTKMKIIWARCETKSLQQLWDSGNYWMSNEFKTEFDIQE